MLIIKDFQSRNTVKKIVLGEKWKNIFYLMLVCVAYVLLWDVLGFILNTFLLMWFSLKIVGGDSVIKSAIIALIISVLTYLIFDTYLGIRFPGGIFNLKF